MRIRCLVSEHNTVPQPGLKPGPLDPGTWALTVRSPRLPKDPIVKADLHQLLFKKKQGENGDSLPREYVQTNEREGTVERR